MLCPPGLKIVKPDSKTIKLLYKDNYVSPALDKKAIKSLDKRFQPVQKALARSIRKRLACENAVLKYIMELEKLVENLKADIKKAWKNIILRIPN